MNQSWCSCMKTKRLLDEVVGNFRVKLETIDANSGLRNYSIPRQAWIRGVRLLNHFGAEKALDVIDQRAERAADRGIMTPPGGGASSSQQSMLFKKTSAFRVTSCTEAHLRSGIHQSKE
jgi:hypothetical protein